MISEEQIYKNKEVFLSLLDSIQRDNFNKQGLIDYLTNSDFFTAPASTKYHNSFKGGLCQHSLNVYDSLKTLMDQYQVVLQDPDSIKIISLLHDVSKINFYRTEVKNKKVYYENGTKKDQMGKFDWVAVEGYAVIPSSERFLYGNHECTSEFIIRSFIPLTVEESVAILHHHACMSKDCAQDDISEILNKYPLALFLHLADMFSTYFLENIKNE